MSIPLPYPNINDTDTNDVQTWSSSKILDYLKPALETEVTKTAEETGAEVTFTDVDPDTCEITKAVIEILPSQQGSGDPSPSNPRTINSFDTVHITQHNADNTEATTYDISLGETVYAITGDAVTGEFEKTYSVVDLGSLNWTYYTSETEPYFRVLNFGTSYSPKLPTNSSTAANLFCSIFKAGKSGSTGTSGSLQDHNYEISLNPTGRLFIIDSDYTDASDLISALTGVYMVFELATPAAITADPITSDLYEGTNVLGCAPEGTIDIEITCTDTIDNILKKEGIL